jgi:flagellar hook-associated protein 3 FlgL
MRITPNATAYNALYNIQQGRSKLDSLSEKLASESNVNRPSDDPIATNVILDANARLQATDQFSSNITKANTFLNMTSTALQGISDTLTTAKKLVSTITSGSSDATTRQNAVSQLTTLREQLVDMGNTQYQGQYIFSGTKTTTAPFSDTSVAYSGDTTVNSVAIDTSATEKMNITGDRVLTSGTGVNILQTMDNLINAVNLNDVSGIQAGAKNLETGFDQITNLQTEVASRLTRLDSTSNMLSITKNTLETIRGNVQDADMYKLGVQLTLQQTAFEASLSATAKISQLSLLNYM